MVNSSEKTLFEIMDKMVRLDYENCTIKGQCCPYEDQHFFITILGTIGIIFNFIGVVHLLLKGRSKCFNNLLATMALADIIFLGLSSSLGYAALTMKYASQWFTVYMYSGFFWPPEKKLKL